MATKKLKPHEVWLQRHAQYFPNGVLPSPYQRRALFALIRLRGTKVAFVTPQGSVMAGVTVMRSSHPDTWVCDMGGRHGRPGLCSITNVVWVSGAKHPGPASE